MKFKFLFFSNGEIVGVRLGRQMNVNDKFSKYMDIIGIFHLENNTVIEIMKGVKKTNCSKIKPS